MFRCICIKKKKKVEIKNNLESEPKKDKIKSKVHLICDDAFSNRLVLSKYIDLYGCKWEESENGLDAIEKVKKNSQYDIIWMDVKMPKMNGIEATEYLRKNLNYDGIIIGLTGYVDELTVKQCYSAGMNFVLSKPFNKNIIKMYVDNYSF
jgi:CheY-like chemotaxis protein